jgi:S1-C subfamily serine protease
VTSTAEREVRISWLDEVTDLALLTINASGALTIEKAQRTRLIKLPAGFEFVDPLTIEEAQGTPLTLSNRTPEVGDSVFAVGNPHGLEGTFSSGIVSGVRGQPNGLIHLQITAPI